MFKPKQPPRILEKKTSELDIYVEDSNFEDYLTFEDNSVYPSGLSSGTCSPQTQVRQDLPGSNDILEVSKDQQQPDLACSRLASL